MALNEKSKPEDYPEIDFSHDLLRRHVLITDKKILQDLSKIDADWENQIAAFETRHQLDKSIALSNVSSQKALIRSRIKIEQLDSSEKEQILLAEKECDLDQVKLEMKFKLEKCTFLCNLSLEMTSRKMNAKNLTGVEKKYLREISEEGIKFVIDKTKSDIECYLAQKKLEIEKKWTEEKLQLDEK